MAKTPLKVVGKDDDAPQPPAVVAQPPAAEMTATDQRSALFVHHLVLARVDNQKLEEAQEMVRLVKKGRTRNRNNCKTDGFPLRDLDDILADEQRPFHELEDAAERRTFMRNEARVPVLGPQQLALFGVEDATPAATAEDDSYWEAVGYRYGLRGMSATPQEYGVPPDKNQPFMEGWGDAQAKLTMRLGQADKIEARRQRAADGIGDDDQQPLIETETQEQQAAAAAAGVGDAGLTEGDDDDSFAEKSEEDDAAPAPGDE